MDKLSIFTDNKKCIKNAVERMLTMHIKLLASECAVNDMYLETVDRIAHALGLTYTLEKVTDSKTLQQYDVFVGCMYGYCPSCNRLHADKAPEERFTPALVINEVLELHSSFPEDEEIRDTLLSHT